MNIRQILIISLFLIILIVVACSAKTTTSSFTTPAQTPPESDTGQKVSGKPAWELEWDKTVSAAKKEGKVVIYASSIEVEALNSVSKTFKEKFGITPEFVIGTPSETARKILTERQAGLYQPDVHIGGTVMVFTMLAPAGAFNRMDEALTLPEVKDPKFWLGGKPGWMEGDNDHIAIIFLSYVSPRMFINTDLVKQGELTSWKDLLSPKWKGKIVMADPGVPSAASNWFNWTIGVMSEKYMRDLVNQEPKVLRDERLVTEWLAQGKYPVATAVSSSKIAQFVKAGAHIGFVKPSEYRDLTVGSGLLSLMNQAPHPNAAKVFINWFLTKEGQTLFSEGQDAQSRRVDVPTDKLNPVGLREPGVKYMEDTVETIKRQGENMKLAQEIFGPLSGR